MKKITSFLICISIIFSLLSINCFAEEQVRISYVKANLPEFVINAYCKDDNVDVNNVNAVFDAEQLKVESAEMYSSEEHVEHVFLLVDLSVSIPSKYFNEMKSTIKQYAESSGDNTYFTLVTFGADVSVPLQFSNNKNDIVKTVDGLKNDQRKTKLFSALSKAIEVSKSTELTDMEYAVLFSDGEDCQFGDVTEKEVEKQLENAVMPIYAMCANTGGVSSSDIENVRTLVSLSGGSFYLYKSSDTSNTFKELISSVHSQYIIRAKSSTNKFSGKTQSLFIKINDIQSDAVSLSSRSQTDSDAPTFSEKVEYDKKTNALLFSISEPIINKKGDGPSKSDFNLTGKKGKKYKIDSIEIKEQEGQITLIVIPERTVSNGKYTLTGKSVTDDSMEKNKLEPFKFSVEKAHSKIGAAFIDYWYVFLATVLFLVAVVLLVLFIRKKRQPIHFNGSKQESIRISKGNGLPITLYVDSGDGVIKTIKYELIKSAIVGRSNNCDITIDDAKMSRQHFCIGTEKNNLIVADMETTNGTYINGVRIKSPHPIKSGDRIYAGITTVSVEF